MLRRVGFARILLLERSTVFSRYVAAVGLAAGVEVVPLDDAGHLAVAMRRHRPATVIADLPCPDRDMLALLPVLAGGTGIDRLVILADSDGPSLTRAADHARTGGTWAVETWTKPVHAVFLKERLGAFARPPSRPPARPRTDRSAD